MNYDYIMKGKARKVGTSWYLGRRMLKKDEIEALVWDWGLTKHEESIYAHVCVTSGSDAIIYMSPKLDAIMERFSKHPGKVVLHPCFVCDGLDIIYLNKCDIVLCKECGTLSPLESWVYRFYNDSPSDES